MIVDDGRFKKAAMVLPKTPRCQSVVFIRGAAPSRRGGEPIDDARPCGGRPTRNSPREGGMDVHGDRG